MSSKIISFVSTKGGVGKSSCTIMVANFLASAGKSVLVVDTDYSNSTTLFFLESKSGLGGKGFSAAIRNRNLLENVVPTRNQNIDIIPSNSDIETLKISDNETLKNIITNSSALSIYDYIIIDTSQGYNPTVANAIVASDIILTPVMLCQFDMISCLNLQAKITELQKSSSWGLFFNGVNQYAQNKNSSHYQYISLYKKTYSQCLNVFLPKTSVVTNAIDRDMKITRKINEKLYEGIKALAELITQEQFSDIENF